MRKCVIGILLMLVSAPLALSIQNSNEWIKYKSAEGRYVVSVPGQPKVSTQEATAATGDKFQQYMATVIEPGDVVYVVGYFDQVPGTIFSADLARDGMVKGVNGALISEAPIRLDGYPGRELKVSAKASGGNEYVLRARYYEAEKRIYVLQFIFPKSLESDALNAKGTKYLDSFQVVKN